MSGSGYQAIKSESSGPPEDTGGIAYVIMLIEGVGNLFPWNVFITAAAYFATRFCGTAFEETFENYFSISYTLSQTVGLALSIIYEHKLAMNTKIFWPLICYTSAFLVTTALVLVNIDGTSLFWITLLSSCFCGVCGAFLSAGLFGLGGLLPPKYTGALMTGQAVAGLVVSVSSILTTLASKDSTSCDDDNGNTNDDSCSFSMDTSALAYFLIATLVLVICLLSYLVLKKLQFVNYFLTRFLDVSPVNSNPLLEDGLLEKEDDNEISSSSLAPVPDSSDLPGFRRVVRVFKEVMIPALSVTAVFSVTIGLFPSLTVLIESTEKCHSSSRFSNDLFIPFMFLMFNLFDLVGRLVAGAFPCPFTPQTIWIPAALRFVFFPLFLFCNVSGSSLPIWFNHDAFPILFMILFAFSSGYVASNCMMMGPTLTKPSDSQLAGTIMVFCLTIGLLCGASLSFLAVAISKA